MASCHMQKISEKHAKNGVSKKRDPRAAIGGVPVPLDTDDRAPENSTPRKGIGIHTWCVCMQEARSESTALIPQASHCLELIHKIMCASVKKSALRQTETAHSRETQHTIAEMEKLQASWKQPDMMSREQIGEAIELLQRAIRVGQHTLGDIENQARDLIETSKLELARTMRDAKRITVEQTIAKKSALERATAEWVDKLDQYPLPKVPLPEVPAPEVPMQLDEDRRKKRLLNFTGGLTPANAPASIVQGEIAPTQSLVDVQPLPRTTDSANNATTFSFRGPPSLQRFFEDGWATAAEQYSRPSTPLTIYQEVEAKSPGVCPESPDTREPRLRRSKRRLPSADADASVPIDAATRDPQEKITPSDFSPNTQPRREVTAMADDPTTQMWLEVMSLDKQITKLQA
ncbi:hypothetical protein BJ166DRAFT_577087 [Pestalotiopsis sp. NC0098]|nr:hypothetical protein BJ166DRAFT_577087 [Pestalotiopsis sp. NC0098]